METKDAQNTVDARAIATIRTLAADIVQKANSGHPGAPIGCAPMAHTLFGSVMRYDPANPLWPNRDRFVLSNGHACALLYSMLHLTGYERPTMEDLKSFRQLGSVCAGHPENFLLDAVEVSTGPLGQGISNAVGLAIAERHLAARFNRDDFQVVDHHTYVICGDGCLQEGVSAEASSLAGHLKLGKLIVLYDDNNITIDGETGLSFTEDVGKRYEAYGWHVTAVEDGNSSDTSSLKAAIAAAKAVTNRPSLIKVRTVIGIGSLKQNTHSVHGSPLGAEDLAQFKERNGFNPAESFVVPDEVRACYAAAPNKGPQFSAAWDEMMTAYAAAHPELAAEFNRRMQPNSLPEGWRDALPRYTPGESAVKASRNYSQDVINALAPIVPELMGGSADLTPSNKTNFKGCVDFQYATPEGRYMRFGVREHGMAAVCNGMAAHGGILPYCATFLTFTGYALGAMRLSALSHFRVVYVMTHDSIGLGEDGPTHQPIETLASLRAMPNMLVLRPADGNETSGAYAVALEDARRPTTIALSRQKLPHLPGTSIEGVAKGGYILVDVESPRAVLVASGSEVSLCVEAAKLAGNVRVVSMPSWELFEMQSAEHHQAVLSGAGPVISVEAACTTGWSRYSHVQVGINSFGKSAPGGECFKHFGFTPQSIADKVNAVVQYFEGKPVPPLMLPSF